MCSRAPSSGPGQGHKDGPAQARELRPFACCLCPQAMWAKTPASCSQPLSHLFSWTLGDTATLRSVLLCDLGHENEPRLAPSGTAPAHLPGEAHRSPGTNSARGQPTAPVLVPIVFTVLAYSICLLDLWDVVRPEPASILKMPPGRGQTDRQQDRWMGGQVSGGRCLPARSLSGCLSPRMVTGS